MGVQVTIAANQIDKERLGYHAISLTHFIDTAEPSIAAGSKVEIGGALYEFVADETGTGWAGLGASSVAYILITPAGAACSWSYTTTAPTWDTAKQGWYTGTARVVGMLYKDAASLYQFKKIILPGERLLSWLVVIGSTVNPFVFNLPPAIGGLIRITIVNSTILATGLVRIVPSGAGIIGPAGNVACYLQNVDQSGAVYPFQFLDLLDDRSGYWAVVGGQFCPDQAVDTDGLQYHLGKLHHLPLGNVTDRTLGSIAPPAAGAWSAARTGAGVAGVPTGAKAVRVRVMTYLSATAAGAAILRIAFSDNNANVPTATSAHAAAHVIAKAVAAADQWGYCQELDIPLNSAGQFYIYTEVAANVTVASSWITPAAVGFYMGD